MSRTLAALLLVVSLGCASLGCASGGGGGAAGSGAYDAADFQPLGPGTSWNFLEDSKGQGHQVVAPQGEPVNGVPTTLIETTAGRNTGNRLWVTNDAKGLRLHRSLEPDKEGRDLVFEPPVVMLPAGFSVGDTFNGSGDVGASPIFGKYKSTAKVVAIDDVKTPAGSFKAVRVETNLTLTGFMAGSPTQLVNISTNRYAKNVGIVQSKGSVDGEAFLSELTKTSVKLCPDVAGTGGSLSGCP